MSIWFERLYGRYPDLIECADDIQAGYDGLRQTFAQGGKLLICGNGGSAADAEHIVGELMKGFLQKRPVPPAVRAALEAVEPGVGRYIADRLQGALPAISLVSHTALVSAFANDVDPDLVFAQQVYGYGRPGDAVLGISTSGNSRNVLHALRVGRALGLRTVAVTGKSGGLMADIADVTVRVPWVETADAQERHLALYHAWCAQLEEDLFPTPVLCADAQIDGLLV